MGNQHSGICGSFPPEPIEGTKQHETWDKCRRDTVTQLVFPLCNCKQQKHFNDSAVECEMNKFDCVMQKLSLAQDFTQVIAADVTFEVFRRAWCVSEMAVASSLQIKQQLLLYDLDSLYKMSQSLTRMSVCSCEASRIEDKELILRKIGDTEAFDRRLQWLFFGSSGILRYGDYGTQTNAVARI